MADSDLYSEKDAQERFEKNLRGALATPPKTFTPNANKKPNLEKSKGKKEKN